MEYSFTEPLDRRLNRTSAGDEPVTRSLDLLLAANAATARERSLYPNLTVELEAKKMRRPINDRMAFAYFGLMLGSLPPASFFLLFIVKGSTSSVHPLAFVLMSLTIIAASLVGY